MTSDYDHDALLPLTEGRRAIFERAVSKFRALGTPIDGDPAFVELVGKWIAGDADMREVAKSYSELQRSKGRRASAALSTVANLVSVPAQTTQEQLLAELEQVIGIVERE